MPMSLLISKDKLKQTCINPVPFIHLAVYPTSYLRNRASNVNLFSACFHFTRFCTISASFIILVVDVVVVVVAVIIIANIVVVVFVVPVVAATTLDSHPTLVLALPFYPLQSDIFNLSVVIAHSACNSNINTQKPISILVYLHIDSNHKNSSQMDALCHRYGEYIEMI